MYVPIARLLNGSVYSRTWYRQQLKEQIAPLLAKWQPIIGVKVDEWGVKQMKTKWGACNIQKKRIWINLELAKKPQRCLEYIIVHELIHLLERLHNERFLAYMDGFMPQWKKYREELNNFPGSKLPVWLDSFFLPPSVPAMPERGC